ncbi:MAG: response regulator [Meiothermus ruber]|jgi:DNA-binding response OmpR family regulator|uniref:Response regulator n=1 Tax=Meiothermus ruber TaxID=277 RepID=A0A7C3DLQ1_MEIRU|nr:response regulator [Meiothermus ruber]
MILAVDDEPHIRHVLRLVLQRAGYEVLVADNAREALDIWQSRPEIRLLVTDLVMPGMNGFDLIRQVRQTSSLPILVLTASGEEQFEIEARQLGADAFLTKPFSREELLREVSRLLG